MNIKNQKLFEEIEKGRLGLNKGLPIGLSKLNDEICGIQRSRYDLIFAKEKAGKSAYVNSCYILNPYDYLYKQGKTEDFKCFYFSLEMSEVAVLSKWYADKIFREEKILIDSKIVLSKGENYFNDELLEKAKKYIPYFDKMLDNSVELICGQNNPTGIYKHVKAWLHENGSWVNGYYVPNNPEITIVIIIDTAGNLKLEKVEGITSMKTTIDKMSEYNREFRDKYNCTPVMIMHTNRATDNYARDSDNDIIPKTSDIKETGQVVQDANLCITIFDPSPYYQRKSIEALQEVTGKYRLDIFRKKFRSIFVLTNRDGECFNRFGAFFIGEIGRFYELPKPDEEKELSKWYERIKTLIKLETKRDG